MPGEVSLRPHGAGDMGWVVHRHGVIYAAEYGFDLGFEALVAEIVAGFLRGFLPGRERCWIAERDGAILGSCFVVRVSDELCKLRLVYVEPAARGLGLGRRLVEEAMRFGREAGYRRMTLWTNDIHVAARAIYARLGFEMTDAVPNHSFGRDMVAETWERAL